jgi:hypothetical protein
MAIYIEIRKVFDNLSEAEYEYIVSEEKIGRLKINKFTGDVELINLALDDDEKMFYNRAAYKIKKHRGAGELPDKTCWAS